MTDGSAFDAEAQQPQLILVSDETRELFAAVVKAVTEFVEVLGPRKAETTLLRWRTPCGIARFVANRLPRRWLPQLVPRAP